MDWSRIDSQLEAVQDAVVEAAGQAAIEVERARRALDRLEALERLIDEQGPALPAASPTRASELPQAASGAPGSRPGGARASLHRSPLVDLFRDTAALCARSARRL